MWILFDDARPHGAPPRLYRAVRETIVASAFDEVEPALERVRSAVAAGAHAAGYLAFEAGYALEPKLARCARLPYGPLLTFGLFDGFETPHLDALLPPVDGAFAGTPRPRIARDDYEAAVEAVRGHLFAGDFYQANLTFG
jgi:para-aminobenzoate synthetase/4-amino-4-deoxychorismate lyase